MLKPLRAGVIGVGHLGQHHARHYAGLPGAVLAGVCDADGARAKMIADRHGAQAWTSLDELLRHVDLVSVAVPTVAHFAAAKACLEAGKHVLVEKPIAATATEARELVETAARHGCLLQVGHSERFNPIMQQMRSYIERPAFIEGHRLSPFGERGTDVDVVLDLMIHDLDLVLSFNPGPVEEVRAAGVPVLSPNIDIANARIAFAGGCVANLTASRVSTNRMRRLRVFQRDRYVSIDFQTRQAVVSRRVQAGGAKPTIDIEPFQAGNEEPLRLELDSFIRAVSTGSRPVVSGEDGEAALNLAGRVLDAIGQFTQRHAAAEPGS
ncbi:MAG: Myo-inositol 2-dehydrogenase [Nitrospirae bacterium]|nr:Myo-inositol 2-dehydrogenase [Nitrospirota bacterium]MCE7964303.1 gfo/Idh/MocA family oxidoreductase [Nitrospira sp. NTP2]MCK6492619.1 Gfo/Idh/MocA family oxidoreductase [Nitrospira sp.]MEB2337309.1 Gfo/Idh/MocA family oxidoreductase [Nitrospirales bacterium]QOJ36625.1 MAG: Gfo/Idh/MocA family oxidoreductase [Nitrospira sp.]